MSDRFSFGFPAHGRHLAAVREWCRLLLQNHLPPERLDGLLLALSEACANTIKYGKPSQMEIEVRRPRGRAEIRILRFCRTGEVHCIKSRRLKDVKPGGLGMRFIAQSVDDMTYAPGGDGSLTLVLTQRCKEGRGGD